MIELAAFFSIGIVGVIASLVMKYIKKKFGTDEYVSMAVIIALSIVLATVFSMVKDTVWLERFYIILSNATLCFNFFIKKR